MSRSTSAGSKTKMITEPAGTDKLPHASLIPKLTGPAQLTAMFPPQTITCTCLWLSYESHGEMRVCLCFSGRNNIEL